MDIRASMAIGYGLGTRPASLGIEQRRWGFTGARGSRAPGYSGQHRQRAKFPHFGLASITRLLEQRYTRVHRDGSSHDDSDVRDFQCHDSLPR